MSEHLEDRADNFAQQINESHQKACAYKDRLKRALSRYSIINIILSALATFVAGQAVVLGMVLRDWKLTCTVAGGFALGATIVAGMQKQLADPDILAEASECCARLKSLRIETAGRKYDLEKVRSAYQQIINDCRRVEC